MTALFTRDGERYVAAPEGRAMWYPNALHGGPIAALFAREAERLPSDVPMRVVRLTVALRKPVPSGVPLDMEVEVARRGKRILAADLRLCSEGTPLAECAALAIRQGDVTLPDLPSGPPPPQPEGFDTFPAEPAGEAWYHVAAIDFRFVEGAFHEFGPATAWFRLTMPVVDGEEPTPLQRVASAADFGNGISMILNPAEYVFINPDVTLYVHRDPVDEWVCLRARSEMEPTGVGLARSEILDRQGPIGTALQSLFVEHREGFHAEGRFRDADSLR
jgi:hypothetical protein